jgi:tetratricopeptide (TPR) repeat protein
VRIEALLSPDGAREAARGGDVAAALAACERAIEAAPDGLLWYLAKGRILRESGGDAGVALRALRKATECPGANAIRAEALVEYGLALESIGRNREAAAAFEDAIVLLPAGERPERRAELHNAASRAHERSGDDARALARLREAVAMRSGAGEAPPGWTADLLAREAGLLERLGQMRELFGCYKRLVEVAPDRVLFAQPDEQRGKAAVFERLRRLLVAINEHLAAEPDDWVARIVKAGFFFRLGRYRQAEQLLRTGVDAGRKHFYADHLLGKIRLRTGRPAQALEALERARPAAPVYLDLERDRAAALEACDRAEEALAAYDAIEAQWPGRRELLLRAARLRESLGRVDEAYATYERAAAAPGGAPERETHEKLASLAARLGRPRDAARHLDAAIALAPAGGATRALRLDRAGARAAAGDLEGALADADAALAPEGDPKDGVHREALARRIEMLVRLDRGEEALAASDALVALEGEGDERTLLLRGDALRAARRFPESVKYYRLAADRKLAEALLDAGAKLVERADYSKALGRLNESFRRNPQSWEVYYFAAAAYARLEEAAPAAKYLEAAARVNRGAVALMEKDRDFDAVRASPEVVAVVAAHGTAPAQTQAQAQARPAPELRADAPDAAPGGES